MPLKLYPETDVKFIVVDGNEIYNIPAYVGICLKRTSVIPLVSCIAIDTTAAVYSNVHGISKVHGFAVITRKYRSRSIGPKLS